MTILIVCFYFSEANRQNAPTNKPLPEPAQVAVTPGASRSDLSQGNKKSPKSFFMVPSLGLETFTESITRKESNVSVSTRFWYDKI